MTYYKLPQSMLDANNRKLKAVLEYSKAHMPRLPYHNFEHAHEFALAARKLADLENCGAGDAFCLLVTGYLHDLIYIPGAKDNEEKSAELSCQILPKIGFEDYEARLITASLIPATKLPANPKTLLEKIACDADLYNLSTPAFFHKNEAVREELGITQGLEWQERSLEFLLKHRYCTVSAQCLWEPGKQKNIETLLGAIEAAYDTASAKTSEEIC